MSENPLKVQIDYTKHNRTLFSCSRKEFLLDEDEWSELADEEGWASVVNVQNEYGDHIVKLEADDCGGINLNLDLYKDEIEALKDKYLILKGECWGGGNSKEEDAEIHGDDGEFSEVGDLNFKPSTVRLGLIEDIVNESGDIISVGGYTGLKYDIPEEYICFYEIRNGELIEIEYDTETDTWEELPLNPNG